MIQIQNKEIFIFDFDGTIADMVIDWDGWMEGIYHLMKKYDPTFSVEHLYEVENLQNYFLEQYGRKGLLQEMTNFSNLYEERNCKRVEPIQKCIEFIVQRKNIVVWTNNGTSFVQKQLEKLDLSRNIHLVVGRDLMTLIKPDSEAFYNHIWDHSTPKDKYVFVGNDLDNDAGAAKGAGIDFLDVREL